jgi:transcription-repair coupling factor (superfamily II helicase)
MPTLASAAVPDSLADLLPVVQSAEGFEPVAEALRAGRSGAVDGAWGSAAALAVAAMARVATGPVLVVLAHPGDLDAWAGDLASLTAERPAVFPAFDSLPGERPRFDAATATRLRLLQQFGSLPPWGGGVGWGGNNRPAT